MSRVESSGQKVRSVRIVVGWHTRQGESVVVREEEGTPKRGGRKECESKKWLGKVGKRGAYGGLERSEDKKARPPFSSLHFHAQGLGQEQSGSLLPSTVDPHSRSALATSFNTPHTTERGRAESALEDRPWTRTPSV